MKPKHRFGFTKSVVEPLWLTLLGETICYFGNQGCDEYFAAVLQLKGGITHYQEFTTSVLDITAQESCKDQLQKESKIHLNFCLTCYRHLFPLLFDSDIFYNIFCLSKVVSSVLKQICVIQC